MKREVLDSRHRSPIVYFSLGLSFGMMALCCVVAFALADAKPPHVESQVRPGDSAAVAQSDVGTFTTDMLLLVENGQKMTDRTLTVGSWPASAIDGGPWWYSTVTLLGDWSCARAERDHEKRWECRLLKKKESPSALSSCVADSANPRVCRIKLDEK